MSNHIKTKGTTESEFQLGLNNSKLVENAGDIEARNAAGSALVNMKVATPLADSDAVTKKYADTISKPVIIADQVDTSSSIPNNTAARRLLVVSTAGSGAAIGNLLFDNGLSDASPMEILATVEGRCIAITDALSGGTVTFDPDSIYIWDADGTAWAKIGDVGSTTGAKRMIRFSIDNSASQDSVSQIPANNIVTESRVIIVTPYSAGATIDVGDTGTADKYHDQLDVDPQTAGTYIVPQSTDQGGSASVVRKTVGGAPAAGAGFIEIDYVAPNA